MGNIAVLFFRKELKFHRFFKFQFIWTFAEFIVSIIAVFVLRNVWALAAGLMAGAFTKCIVSYIVEPYRPRLRFIRSQAKELFRFGKWVLGSSILIFFITQGDDLFVGSILGATMLGFYQMAYRISNISTAEINHIIVEVSFPLYSKMQDDLNRMRKTYLSIFQVVTFISFPIAGLIIVLVPGFTRIFLGEQWLPVIPVIQLIAISGLLGSIITLCIPLFRALGRPGVETAWQIVRAIIILASIYPLTVKYGIIGTSFSLIFGALFSGIGFCVQAVKILKCGVWAFLKILIIPLTGTLIMVLALYLLRTYLVTGEILSFVLLLSTAAGLFVFMVYLADRFLGYGIKLLFKKWIGSFIKG